MSTHEFRMPSLGADMDEGRVVEWKVAPGAHVNRGDIVAVVDTDKADIDVEIFETGTIDTIVVPEGDRVPVGTVLATVRVDEPRPVGQQPEPVPPPEPMPPPEPIPPPEPMPPPEPLPPPEPVPPPESVPPEAPQPPVPPIRGAPTVSPVVRRLARHLGVDLASVTGTGPDHRVTRADVERAAEVRQAASEPVQAASETVKAASRASSMRAAIGELMARSKREVPHYYLAEQIELGTALAWLADRNASRPVTERVLPSVLLLKAAAHAARDVPRMNGFWVDDRFVASDDVHLGVAVALRDGGLIAPAIHHADRLTPEELMTALRDLVGRVRSGRLRASEMSDPTITVTNLGEQGVELVHGVIYPPQVALVGFGAILDRPWARDGMLGIRPVVTATLAADHRASDGREGARLLTAIEHLLQEPEKL